MNEKEVIKKIERKIEARPKGIKIVMKQIWIRDIFKEYEFDKRQIDNNKHSSGKVSEVKYDKEFIKKIEELNTARIKFCEYIMNNKIILPIKKEVQK